MANSIRLIFAENDQQQWSTELEYQDNQTIADYLERAQFYQKFPYAKDYPVGIYGVKCDKKNLIGPNDRIEVYPPLICDPKQARLARVKPKRKSKD